MATSMHTDVDPQLVKADKKISDLKEDIRRLSAAPRLEESALTSNGAVAPSPPAGGTPAAPYTDGSSLAPVDRSATAAGPDHRLPSRTSASAHITQPTHNRGHTLDLVITYGLFTGVSSVVDLAVSDHYCVYFNITSFSHKEAPVRTVRKRYLTSEVAANFIQILQNTPAEILPAPCDFIVDNLNSKLKSTLDSVAPLLTKTIKTKPTPPWRNDNIKRLKRKCRSAERWWRKTKLTVHFEILCKQLKTCNKTVKQARISHFSKLISDHKNNPKFLFSTFDLLTSTNFNKPSNISTDALCEDFADHFRSKIDDIRSSLLSQQNVIFNTPGSLLLPEETLENFVLVDARTLGRVFSQATAILPTDQLSPWMESPLQKSHQCLGTEHTESGAQQQPACKFRHQQWWDHFRRFNVMLCSMRLSWSLRLMV
ncbi:hypothetical protein ABVT39_024753 [Epinephelus coioides]